MEVYMSNRSIRIGMAGTLVAWALAAGLAAQGTSTQKPAASTQKPVPTVKAVRAVPIVSVEGKANFEAYCAVCHGQDAKGNGPAAPAMKVPPPDLTALAAKNKGKFDENRVAYVINGKDRTASTPAHGVEDMPIWGEVFRSEGTAKQTLRISNLVHYIQSIQQKP
jgi:mono/diheme cytochrome c family protein